MHKAQVALGALILLTLLTPLAYSQPTLDACTLEERDQAAALSQFRALKSRYRVVPRHAEVTLEFHGDHASLGRTLDQIAAREAACCEGLGLERTRTPTGFRVTVSGDGALVEVVSTLLAASLE